MGAIKIIFSGIVSWCTGGLSTIFANYGRQLLIGLAVAAVLGGGCLYWTHLQNKIATLTQQNTILTSTVNTQDQTISKLRDRVKQIQKDLDDYHAKNSNIDNNAKNQKNQFNYGPITSANKKDVEKSVNNAYTNMFNTITTQTQPNTFK